MFSPFFVSKVLKFPLGLTSQSLQGIRQIAPRVSSRVNGSFGLGNKLPFVLIGFRATFTPPFD